MLIVAVVANTTTATATTVMQTFLSSVFFLLIHFYFLRNIICWTWHFCLLLLLFVCSVLRLPLLVRCVFNNKLCVKTVNGLSIFIFSVFVEMAWFCFSFGKYDFAFVC